MPSPQGVPVGRVVQASAPVRSGRLRAMQVGHLFPRLLGQSEYNDRVKAVAPLMEAALRWLAEATPGSAELLRLMDATPVPCGASAVTARRSGLYGYRRVPGWKSTPTPTSSTHTREPSYLAGRLSVLDARPEDVHMGCSMQTRHGPVMQTRASASDVPDATRPSDPRS